MDVIYNVLHLGTAANYVWSFAVSGTTIFAGTNHGVFQAELSTLTGLNQVQNPKADFSIYPNPTSSTFSIHFSTTSFSSPQLLQVYNITGKLILSEILQGGNAVIDPSGWAEGVYNVRVSLDKCVENKRVVVVR